MASHKQPELKRWEWGQSIKVLGAAQEISRSLGETQGTEGEAGIPGDTAAGAAHRTSPASWGPTARLSP